MRQARKFASASTNRAGRQVDEAVTTEDRVGAQAVDRRRCRAQANDPFVSRTACAFRSIRSGRYPRRHNAPVIRRCAASSGSRRMGRRAASECHTARTARAARAGWLGRSRTRSATRHGLGIAPEVLVVDPLEDLRRWLGRGRDGRSASRNPTPPDEAGRWSADAHGARVRVDMESRTSRLALPRFHGT